jgi:hypothetical protein
MFGTGPREFPAASKESPSVDAHVKKRRPHKRKKRETSVPTSGKFHTSLEFDLFSV